jgi:hypothetical protein
VPHFASLTYKDVYPGIDLVYHSSAAGQMEYDFDIAAGADPSAIQLAFDEVNSASVHAQGNLLLHTPGGPVVEQAPAAYQGQGANRHADAVSQQVSAAGTTSFAFGLHDPSTDEVVSVPITRDCSAPAAEEWCWGKGPL